MKCEVCHGKGSVEVEAPFVLHQLFDPGAEDATIIAVQICSACKRRRDAGAQDAALRTVEELG